MSFPSKYTRQCFCLHIFSLLSWLRQCRSQQLSSPPQPCGASPASGEAAVDELTEQQQAFFKTFGFLLLRGLVKVRTTSTPCSHFGTVNLNYPTEVFDLLHSSHNFFGGNALCAAPATHGSHAVHAAAFSSCHLGAAPYMPLWSVCAWCCTTGSLPLRRSIGTTSTVILFSPQSREGQLSAHIHGSAVTGAASYARCSGFQQIDGAAL